MSRTDRPWTITRDPATIRDAYATGLSAATPKAFKTLPMIVEQFAALEAERLTSTAEPDVPPLHAVMSGGAEPAGAAKPSPEQT